MKIGDLRIGTRLGLSFGAVLVLAVVLIVLATSYLSRIGDLSKSMFSDDWPKAQASLQGVLPR